VSVRRAGHHDVLGRLGASPAARGEEEQGEGAGGGGQAGHGLPVFDAPKGRLKPRGRARCNAGAAARAPAPAATAFYGSTTILCTDRFGPRVHPGEVDARADRRAERGRRVHAGAEVAVDQLRDRRPATLYSPIDTREGVGSAKRSALVPRIGLAPCTDSANSNRQLVAHGRSARRRPARESPAGTAGSRGC
jgi:hypothetical protein